MLNDQLAGNNVNIRKLLFPDETQSLQIYARWSYKRNADDLLVKVGQIVQTVEKKNKFISLSHHFVGNWRVEEKELK